MRAVSSVVVAALLSGVAAAPAAAAAADPVRMILGLAAGTDPATVVDGIGPWRAVGGLPAITVDVPADGVDAASARWGHDPAVRYLTPDVRVHADGVPADPDDPANRSVQARFQVAGGWS